jgi:hypothetical protein
VFLLASAERPPPAPLTRPATLGRSVTLPRPVTLARLVDAPSGLRIRRIILRSAMGKTGRLFWSRGANFSMKRDWRMRACTTPSCLPSLLAAAADSAKRQRVEHTEQSVGSVRARVHHTAQRRFVAPHNATFSLLGNGRSDGHAKLALRTHCSLCTLGLWRSRLRRRELHR